MEALWLWLLEWKWAREQQWQLWKRLPKGTEVCLVSVRGLEELYTVVTSGQQPVSYQIPNTDILDKFSFLRQDLTPYEDYEIIPKSTFTHVLRPYVSSVPVAVVVWQGVLQPHLHLPSSPFHIIHCLDDRSSLIQIPTPSVSVTIKEFTEIMRSTWLDEVISQPSLYTCSCQLPLSRFDGRKLPFCNGNPMFTPIQSESEQLFRVINSDCVFVEHRTSLLDRFGSVKLGIGLENLGKTCFLNAVLQCLLHIPMFIQHVLTQSSFLPSDSLTNQLKTLIEKMYLSEETGVFRPVGIFEKLCEVHDYDKRTREDASEAFLVVLDMLQREVMRNKEVEMPVSNVREVDEWVRLMQQEPCLKSDLFGGLLQQRLRCTFCQHEQIHLTSFCSLALNLPSPRSFTITIISSDPDLPQRQLKLESNTPLEENALIHSVRELVISETGNANVILGENRNFLLEPRTGLSNLITSNNFIALELPKVSADCHVILVDFYYRTDPICTRAMSVHRGVKLVDVITEATHYLLQVESAMSKGKWVVNWLSRSSNEATFRQYQENSELVYLAHDERVESVSSLIDQGVETVGDLCLNLIDKIPRFRFISGIFSSSLRNFMKTDPSSKSWKEFLPLKNKTDARLSATLMQLLELTLSEKALNEEDLLQCSHCSQACQHVTRMEILRFPRILPLVFQRVRILPTQLMKSFIHIHYPVTGLDLGELEKGVSCDAAVYDLKAVIQHKGGSLTKGHYVACAEDPVTLRWVSFNDEGVSPGHALVEDAYMLFYVRRLD